MRYHTNKAGYSFVEVLVSIAILLIAIVGPVSIATSGIKNATFAREQNVAFFLAQEGLEGVIYLREKAGIEQFAIDGTDTWDWTTTELPSGCRSGGACRIDIATHTVTECDPISECDLRLQSSGNLRYSHASGGEETPYNRRLYFDRTGTSLRVRSVVSWDSNAFGSNREVQLETYLYDMYAE